MHDKKPYRTRRGVLILAATLPMLLSAAVTRAQDLDSLVQQILDRNPAVLAARRAVDAKRALIVPARTLPEPSITFQTMGNLIPPTLMAGDPSSARVLSFSQEFPFPGKLRLEGQRASAEADAELWRYEQVRRDVVAELKTAYYDLFRAQKLIEVAEKSKRLLQQFAEISEAVYKVGKGAQQDLLKAQVEVSHLQDRLTVFHQERETAQARINTLLYRNPEAPVVTPADLPRPKLAYTLDQLYRKAGENNPEVRMNRKEIERSEYSVALAKKAFYPDFEAEFAWFNRRNLPEMYGLMFRAKVPLYFWRKQRPELESAAAGLVQQRRSYDSTLATLYFKLKDPFLKTTTNAELLDLYGNAIVPQATLALESSISSYQVGNVDFLSLLSNQQTVFEYEMKYYEVLSDYYKALTTLESLTGEKLTP